VKRPQRQDEDSKAILERRRFLIQSALAGLGAGALAASCDQQPKCCLSVRELPPKTQTGAQPCLELMPPKASTQTPAAKPGTKTPPKEPRVCLSVREDD